MQHLHVHVPESKSSNYIVDAKSLATVKQYKYSDGEPLPTADASCLLPTHASHLDDDGAGLPGDLTTAHPKVLPDGTLVNFTRSFPFGGYHVYLQDPSTLNRRQIAFIGYGGCGMGGGDMCQWHDLLTPLPLMHVIGTETPCPHAGCMTWQPVLIIWSFWRHQSSSGIT